ncbi:MULTISPECIES: AraC family transcriptional regulator [Caldilinea]|jgi:AraC-like DNA-binding protein|uniref:Putative AraC family transcriptional regulator n=1 Tax=Caldilinea aerophila (strain DSM 14535 / JCM 11387 / NBRC 104270 / STL-6-O1) TaxID=926550 RepID=I0I5C1_CALAS|nr:MULTISPECIES: AraC family transcriptional regulator [Caldilinea]BAM00459.1 putative AraC family transcriptional regulator [Caldilinea aerophila DSM 14535 = NBRC 104270]GIV71809.1 MAG: AraC family transcriptional regulator [Caldilinea sp.]
MQSIHHRQAERMAQYAQAHREELVERITRLIRQDGEVQPLPGLHLFRLSMTRGLSHSVNRPAFCVIAQGSKELFLGDRYYRYDPYHYLLVTVDLPGVSQVLEATPARPYLSLRLDLSPALVGSVLVESGCSVPERTDAPAVDVSSLDGELLDAVVRLVRLTEAPAAEVQVLMPLAVREIVYRLLVGDQGARLRHLAIVGGSIPHIARAVECIRRNFDQPLRIDQLAREVGMSVSGFHHYFKAVTGMTPLQFQKQLRLQEARRLMIGENLPAIDAAYRVGYQDASHFNREYKRLFGAPPLRDVQRLRETMM